MPPPPPPPLETPQAARALCKSLTGELRAQPASGVQLDEWKNAQLYLRKARFFLNATDLNSNILALASRELNHARLSLAAIRKDRPVPLVKGQREEGYYSGIDGSYQPYVRYLPRAYKKGRSLPLLIYLHGYSPYLNLVNWQGIPASLIALAEKKGYLIAAPFGRSNTDYQGIGEQDVLAVIREMKRRYGADGRRLILAGSSMGATGAWSLSARHPGLFAGALMISGRGDYYFWHQLERSQVPAWKQTLIDADFAGSQVTNLCALPIFCAHGALDDVVPVEEARYITSAVGAVNPGLVYVEVPEGDHNIWDPILKSRPFRDWLATCRRKEPGRPTPRAGRPLGIKGAFLSPFVFILADEHKTSAGTPRFRQAVIDWFRYAKAMPRVDWELTASSNILQSCNVFLFGEPESSGLIRQVLERSPVRVTPDSFVVGGRVYPRSGNGLYLVQPSPWNPAKLAVIQCGIPWGEGTAENHKYDFLPDYIVYTSRFDDDGSNTALCAGFFDAQGRMVE